MDKHFFDILRKVIGIGQLLMDNGKQTIDYRLRTYSIFAFYEYGPIYDEIM